jgi:hypothetical protein
MDEAKRQEIAQLAADLHDKKLRYDRLAMSNTPLDPEEAKSARIEFELARAEYVEASQKLLMAQSLPADIPEFQQGALSALFGM